MDQHGLILLLQDLIFLPQLIASPLQFGMLRDELPSAHLHFHYTALAQPSFGQRIPLGLHAQLEEMTFQVTHKITHFHPLFADE